MGRRRADMSELLPLVPRLLEHIRQQSGLRAAEVHRQLAAELGMRDDAVKRSWLRWRSVTAQVDGRGRLAQSRSLSRLVRAAGRLGWLKDADESPCGPLLVYLREFDAQHHQDLIGSARRSMDAVRRHVRQVIRQQETTAYDDTTWLSAIYELVAREVARELRRRLLGTAGPNHTPAALGDDLLSGSLSRSIRAVRDAGLKPVVALEEVVAAMEAKVRADFADMVSCFEGD